MRAVLRGLLAVAVAVPLAAVAAAAGSTVGATAAHAEDNGVGLTPALGWSSWSFVRHDPTAATIEAQADGMKRSGLARAGFQYVNLDDFWYICPGSQGPNVDGYGRWVTDPVKFPPSGAEDGIQVAADYVHRLGLKFGLYVTPGISAQAVKQNTPIEGTPYHAADIATTTAEKNYNCKGMVGIDYSKPGAQEFIDSWAKQFAGWGIDYLKIDGVGTPDIPDIQAWSAALKATGRPIHLELSNSLAISAAGTWKELANGWRTGGDIECYSCEVGGSSYPLTSWNGVQGRFNQVANWQPYGGPGGFNDYDSLELGNGVNDGLTVDERKTQMSLWSLAASPLILGTDLTHLDPTDLALLKNRDVLAVDQDAIDAARIVNSGPRQVFAKKEANGDAVVGLFNTSDSTQVVSTTADALGLPAAHAYLAKDLWTHRPTESAGTIAADVPAHGVALLRVRPLGVPYLVPPAVSLAVAGLDSLVPGQPGTVTETYADNGVQPLTGVRLTLSTPAGWTVTPTSPTTFRSVGAGASVQATYRVVEPPPTKPFESTAFTATALGHWYGIVPLSTTATEVATTSPPVQPPLKTYAATTASFAQVGSALGIRASGKDVFGATNQYGAIYRAGAGHDGTVATVQITAQAATSDWAKAGIMVRNDITNANAGAGYLILAEAPGHGYVLQWDANGDGQLDSNSAPSGTGIGTAAYPSWLKLVRSATSYTGYYSTDGTTWTPVGTVSVPSAAASQDVGLFATAHNSNATGEVDFDHFGVS